MSAARAVAPLQRFDPAGPPEVRQRARGGPTAVLRARWTDPDDIRPNAARHAKEVTGYRVYDPLRWNLTRHGAASRITVEHVLAADRLRRAVDVAAYGCTGPRDEASVLGVTYGPRSGPSAAAQEQARAWRDVQRAMATFTPDERYLLTFVVLFTRTVAQWCIARREGGFVANPAAEMAKLVGCLDRLVQHYESEVEQMAREVPV